MKLAVAMIAMACVIPLTSIRRIVPSETVVAFSLTSVVVLGLFVLGQLR